MMTNSVQAKKSEGLSQSKTAEVLNLGIATEPLFLYTFYPFAMT